MSSSCKNELCFLGKQILYDDARHTRSLSSERTSNSTTLIGTLNHCHNSSEPRRDGRGHRNFSGSVTMLVTHCPGNQLSIKLLAGYNVENVVPICNVLSLCIQDRGVKKNLLKLRWSWKPTTITYNAEVRKLPCHLLIVTRCQMT